MLLAAVKVSVAVPLPDAGFTVIQVSVFIADHPQPAAVLTLTSSGPPCFGNDTSVGDNVYWQPLASEIVTA